MLNENEIFGFLKTSVDAHTMGISAIANVLRECGYKSVISPPEVMDAANEPKKVNNTSLIVKWLRENKITVLGFSYRLDPQDGKDFFCSIYNILVDNECFESKGGTIKLVAFAGLPDACKLVERELKDRVLYFLGDETPVESLRKYGVPEKLYPKSFMNVQPYDKALMDFAESYIASEKYKLVFPQDHYGYPECGTKHDSYVKRLEYCKQKDSLPIIRLHAGPYSPNRQEAIKEYISWCRDLAESKLLDVLSIGSSQLTQSNFGEDWETQGLRNGGGVPVNSEIEYKMIADAARPMLVRTYSGTKDILRLAIMHERTINISWHALSYWWFCELDGRGKNDLLSNLKEHIETIKYAASTNKPIEPNVPHHFAFRGSDDVSYIVSAYLAAKVAKKNGIRHMILQNMLNTPKYTWGIEDLAKGRTMVKLVRNLEDDNFKVSLQTRAGLDCFVPNIDKAMVQLAAVTALMDDIEPDNPNSPEIIHVVSYSEAIRLATPDVMRESIKITLGALSEYRNLRKEGKTWDTQNDIEIKKRQEKLYFEATEAIKMLERVIPYLYTAEGLYKVFVEGFFPVPYILDEQKKFPKATKWQTAVVNGGVSVIDENGLPIDTITRYRQIINTFSD